MKAAQGVQDPNMLKFLDENPSTPPPQPTAKPPKLADIMGSISPGGGGMAKAGMGYAKAQPMPQQPNMMSMMQGLMGQGRPQRQNVPLMSASSLMNLTGK